VKGKIGTKAGTIVSDFSHPDPVGMFGAVLWDRLARGGIQIDGSVVRRRGPPPGGNVIFTLTSPISDSLVPINTNSNNGVADQLFFALGHRVVNEGSREGASRAVKRAFELVGVDPTGHVQVDGSGLSRDNRISPNQLTGLLHAVLFGLIDSDPVSQEFLDSLAVMGESGTLSSRMRGTAGEGRIFAKTGFIDGTSSLSGIVITEDGVGVVFSIIVNYQTLGGLNNKAWKPMQDAMVLRMLKL
jgi:D-alanyl-D-alanine carboxypeptidase/D-alanyl-D-alanine-endopeptidase (penicillin-binding protein 4)